MDNALANKYQPLVASFLSTLSDREHINYILLDLDNFQEHNNYFGHQSGDDVIQALTSALESFVSKWDGRAFRVGGDDFALVIPARTPEESVEFANMVLKLIADLNFPLVPVTAPLNYGEMTLTRYITATVASICCPHYHGRSCIETCASTAAFLWELSNSMLYGGKCFRRGKVTSLSFVR